MIHSFRSSYKGRTIPGPGFALLSPVEAKAILFIGYGCNALDPSFPWNNPSFREKAKNKYYLLETIDRLRQMKFEENMRFRLDLLQNKWFTCTYGNEIADVSNNEDHTNADLIHYLKLLLDNAVGPPESGRPAMEAGTYNHQYPDQATVASPHQPSGMVSGSRQQAMPPLVDDPQDLAQSLEGLSNEDLRQMVIESSVLSERSHFDPRKGLTVHGNPMSVILPGVKDQGLAISLIGMTSLQLKSKKDALKQKEATIRDAIQYYKDDIRVLESKVKEYMKNMDEISSKFEARRALQAYHGRVDSKKGKLAWKLAQKEQMLVQKRTSLKLMKYLL